MTVSENPDTAQTTPATDTDGVKETLFTQEQVNRFLAGERRKIEEKYGDYGELKKQVKELDALRQELEQVKKTSETSSIEALRATTAYKHKVPLELLTASTVEDLEAQAEIIKKYRQSGAVLADAVDKQGQGVPLTAKEQFINFRAKEQKNA